MGLRPFFVKESSVDYQLQKVWDLLGQDHDREKAIKYCRRNKLVKFCFYLHYYFMKYFVICLLGKQRLWYLLIYKKVYNLEY